MHLDQIEYYLVEISDREFRPRNVEIQRQVTGIKQEMNKRGLVNSSITVDKFAQFYQLEFEARCEYLVNFILTHLSKVDLQQLEDPVTAIKSFYQSQARKLETFMTSSYQESLKSVAVSNGPISSQVSAQLTTSINQIVEKGNLIIELETKWAVEKADKKEPVLLLTPNFHGVGVDIKALWQRVFKI